MEHPPSPFACRNLVGGEWKAALGQPIDVTSPYTGRVIGTLRTSGAEEVSAAVAAAQAAAKHWRALPLRHRIEPLYAFRAALLAEIDALSQGIALESGKTPAEAHAEVLRGIEVIEFAASLQHLDSGAALEVSRGVTCEYRREPLGVVAGITPFNFPAMVPMWMFPIAVTLGNAFILKPSEKVPISACRLGELMLEAGYPSGVFSVIHGDRETARHLITHEGIAALAFVGSTPAARAVYTEASAQGKRALCLGGAKNAMIVAEDADERLTVKAVVDSFTGCAGQRCMAGSVLIVVGSAARLVEKIVETASRLELGRDMGALIDVAARERLVAAIAHAEAQGATLLLDGREKKPPSEYETGSFLAPTILDQVRADMSCATHELFGPVLSVIRVGSLDEALEIEQASPYGNATSIFTTSGAVARHVCQRATSGMVGVNVGVPVPREPFSFGGAKQSRFGHGDITGRAGVEFWSTLKKITTKWALASDANWMS